MMRILVQIEHVDGVVSDASQELLTLAKSFDSEVKALVNANSADAVASLAQQLGQADTVLGVADTVFEAYLSGPYAASLNAVIAAQSPELVLVSYSTAGMDLAAGASVASGYDIVGYVTELERDGDDALSVTSQVYGGKLMARSTLPLPGIAVVMPGALKAGDISGSANVEMVEIDLSDAVPTHLVETLMPESDDIDLTKAERILCVGRALGGTDKLPVAEALAQQLNAEIAGSRPVIDAGWLPKARQVGKSGTKVKPKLYFMAGVSGAPEHLEGMQESDLIIALNSDEHAPIFAKAHYAAVCDMFDVLPALTERIG